MGDPLPPLRRWLLCAGLLPPGASSRESALGIGPSLPQHEPGDLDTRDSGGENEPTFMGRANPGPFLDAVPDLSGIATSRE